jgi:protein-disulfide isomerase
MKSAVVAPAVRAIAAIGAAIVVVAICWHAQGPARAGGAESAVEYPLTGDDGQQLPNHTIKLVGPIDRLPGVVVVGNPKGRATLAEFYDLNCPYCRAAAADLGSLVEHDPQLRLVLVPFPVLGIPSIGAARVELAVAKLGTPEQFYAFHRKIYAQRGTVDGPRALSVAAGLGLPEQKLLTLGDSDEITTTMKNLVSLGTALGLEATPSFVIGKLAILGYPGPNALAGFVRAAATCGQAVCR